MVESKRKSKDIPEKSIEDNQKSYSSITTNTSQKSVKPKINFNQQKCEEALSISESEKLIEDNQKSDSSIATNTPKKSVKPKTNSNKQDKPKPSPQQRCEEALSISKSEKWIQKSYQRFVDLVVDLSSKYSLTDIQYKILIEAILNCPLDYRSLSFYL